MDTATTEYRPRCNMRMFEGMRTRYPLFRSENRALYWTIEHHSEFSLGAYEVIVKGKSHYFKQLGKAVEFFNKEK